jgi:hypothetical protein
MRHPSKIPCRDEYSQPTIFTFQTTPLLTSHLYPNFSSHLLSLTLCKNIFCFFYFLKFVLILFVIKNILNSWSEQSCVNNENVKRLFSLFPKTYNLTFHLLSITIVHFKSLKSFICKLKWDENIKCSMLSMPTRTQQSMTWPLCISQNLLVPS